MSVKHFQSELLVELTTDQQENLSGGQCPSRVFLNARCGFYTPESPFGISTLSAPAPRPAVPRRRR